MRVFPSLAVISLLLSGCGGFADAAAPAETDRSRTFMSTPADADAELAGDVGPLEGIHHVASMTVETLDFGQRERLDYVELNAHWGDGRWAMLGVDFKGGVNDETLLSGETLRFTNDEWAIDQDVQPDGLYVAAVGCADPDLGDDNSMFDEHATHVTVTRRDHGDEILLDVAAKFADGNELMGTFPVQP